MTPGIPFNRPYLSGREQTYLLDVLASRELAGSGQYSSKCEEWLKLHTGCARALMTVSGTGALEMACILAGLGPGDEVIMPSFTFASTANAVALRGATPVFADIRPDTLNIDETAIEAAMTERTRAILPMHYGGVACDMTRICELARARGVSVIEDATHAIGASWDDASLGTIGQSGAISFHETKNLVSGEGGALLVNDPDLIERAEIIHEKGTNRAKFLRGEIEKYTWVDIGSSFAPSELVSACLFAQMEVAEEIQARRMGLWRRYHEMLAEAEAQGVLKRPTIPSRCSHNAHLYYVLVRDEETRGRVLDHLRGNEIHATFHFVPLHSSPAGRRLGRVHGTLRVTEDAAGRLLRLPLFPDLAATDQERVVSTLLDALAAR